MVPVPGEGLSQKCQLSLSLRFGRVVHFPKFEFISVQINIHLHQKTQTKQNYKFL